MTVTTNNLLAQLQSSIRAIEWDAKTIVNRNENQLDVAAAARILKTAKGLKELLQATLDYTKNEGYREGRSAAFAETDSDPRL